jgi:hypothetical protein
MGEASAVTIDNRAQNTQYTVDNVGERDLQDRKPHAAVLSLEFTGMHALSFGRNS